MRISKIVIIIMFIWGYNNVNAQAFYCPLKNMELIEEDTAINYSSEATLGISFKSTCDTVFSILDGKVVDLKVINNNKSSNTIEYKNNIQVTYFFIRSSALKIGSNISAGKVIGTLYLNDLSNKYILSMFNRKNKLLLNKKRSFTLFKHCIKPK